MTKALAHRALVARRLRGRGCITPFEALDDFGCFRLAARIFELRQDGWDITTDTSDGYAVY